MSIKKFNEMNYNSINEEYTSLSSLLDNENFIAGAATLIGLGGTLVATLLKQYSKAKTKEEKEQVRKDIKSALDRSTGAN